MLLLYCLIIIIACQQTSAFFCLTGYWRDVSINRNTLQCAKPTKIFFVLFCIQENSDMVPNFQIVVACFSCTPPICIHKSNRKAKKLSFKLGYALLDYINIQRPLCNTQVELFSCHCLRKRIYKTQSTWSQCIKRRIKWNTVQ